MNLSLELLGMVWDTYLSKYSRLCVVLGEGEIHAQVFVCLDGDGLHLQKGSPSVWSRRKAEWEIQ